MPSVVSLRLMPSDFGDQSFSVPADLIMDEIAAQLPLLQDMEVGVDGILYYWNRGAMSKVAASLRGV